ncbi:MAG: hypothetical protein IPJ08_25140 [Burkholderiales bacterium]|nr:hypothetical protein [Burkholderiales bacterium]
MPDYAKRLRSLTKTMQAVVDEFNADVVRHHKESDDALRSAESAEKLAASQLRAESELLPGTGERVWKSLFNAAQTYLSTEHLSHEEGAPCALCQTTLSKDAAQRLARFSAFVANDASERASEQRRNHQSLIAALNVKQVGWSLDEEMVGSLNLADDNWQKLVDELKSQLGARRQWLLAAMSHTQEWTDEPALTANPFEWPESLAQSNDLKPLPGGGARPEGSCRPASRSLPALRTQGPGSTQ